MRLALSSVLCGAAVAQDLFLAIKDGLDANPRDMILSDSKDPKQEFTCDKECVRSAAKLQGADVLTDVEKLKYSMEVRLSAEAASGEACGQERRFPAVAVVLDPSASIKLTTVHTQNEPDIVFECEPGKRYHLILNDALGGKFQAQAAYTHWMKLNMACPSSGLARVAGNGQDISQGSPPVPGWFSGKGYLPPAFPYNAFHHFNFYIFETAAEHFDGAELAKIDKEFPQHNTLGGPVPSWTLAQIMEWLRFDAPVARTWMDVTTSYWSQVRMGALAKMVPAVQDMEFYKLICPCNSPDSMPGLHQQGNEECNL